MQGAQEGPYEQQTCPVCHQYPKQCFTMLVATPIDRALKRAEDAHLFCLAEAFLAGGGAGLGFLSCLEEPGMGR